MVLVGAALFPHGAMPFDGDSYSASPDCRQRNAKLSQTMRESLAELYNQTCTAASMVADLEPDLILLCTPHGINLSDAYAVYTNESAAGDASWLNLWSEFKASVSMPVDRSKELLAHLQSHQVSAQGVTCFAGLSAPLRWGEVIPIWYLQKYLKSDPKYLIMSVDLAVRQASIDEQRVEVGAKIAQYARGLKERVVIVISGDLAHSHHSECSDPIYNPDPSYRGKLTEHPAESAQFDDDIVKWVTGGTQTSTTYCAGEKLADWDPTVSYPHLCSAMSIDPNKSTACGARGLMMLHGILVDEIKNGSTFSPHLLVYKVPTYYGMMAAVFVNKSAN